MRILNYVIYSHVNTAKSFIYSASLYSRKVFNIPQMPAELMWKSVIAINADLYGGSAKQNELHSKPTALVIRPEL